MDETAQWCNSFVLVPKPDGKVRLRLDPARISQALIHPDHRGPMFNDIFPKLTNIEYLSLTDASFRYHNVRLDEQSTYVRKFACQFGRYRYKRLSFGAAQAGNIFQRKISEIFKE